MAGGNEEGKAKVKALLQEVFGTFEHFEKISNAQQQKILHDNPTLLRSILVDSEPQDFKKVVSYYPKDELIDLIKTDHSLLTESEQVKFAILLEPLFFNERWSLLESVYQQNLLNELKEKRKSDDFRLLIEELVLSPMPYLDELSTFIIALEMQTLDNPNSTELINALQRLKFVLFTDISKKLDKNIPLEKIQFSPTAQVVRETIALIKDLTNPNHQDKLNSISNFDEQCKGKYTFYDRYVGKIVYTSVVLVTTAAIGAVMGLIIAGTWIPAVVAMATIFGLIGMTMAIKGYEQKHGGREYMDRFRLFKSNIALAEKDVVDVANSLYKPPAIDPEELLNQLVH